MQQNLLSLHYFTRKSGLGLDKYNYLLLNKLRKIEILMVKVIFSNKKEIRNNIL